MEDQIESFITALGDASANRDEKRALAAVTGLLGIFLHTQARIATALENIDRRAEFAVGTLVKG